MTETDDASHRVGTRRVGRVLIVSMERGAKRNAIDRAMADGLDDALNQLDDDDRLWAGVLTGSADVFCAGSDLTAGGDYVTTRGGEYGIIRRRRRKPLIAADRGPRARRWARGGSGVRPRRGGDDRPVRPAGGWHRGGADLRRPLPCAPGVPLNLARQLILTGQPIDAPRAYEVGFVNVLTGPGQALTEPFPWRNRSAPTLRSPCRRAWPPSTSSSRGRRRRTGLGADGAGFEGGRRFGRCPGGCRRLLGKAGTCLDRSLGDDRPRRGPRRAILGCRCGARPQG